ncbi:aspartic proteinase PCS1-like [Hibiscus syriacus]|nr:aspartic proteinase PCS1-like [Hibiscus syriacus]
MSCFRFLLRFAIFLLIFHQNFCFPSKQTLFLPLKMTLSRPPLTFALNSELSSSAFDAAGATTNKIGFHHNVTLTVSLSVGSPPQNVTMILDTGSELSWLHCKKTPNLTSAFTPELSNSYNPVPCAFPVCKTRTRDLTIPASCDPNNQLCHVAISYADASSIEGTLAYENFVIGSSTRPGFLFGCMDSGFSSNPDEDSKTTGLMGMNRGSLSFVRQMGFLKFSYCISGFDSSGVLLLGDTSFSWLKTLNYTPLIQMSDPLPYFDRVAYTVQLEGIKVGDKMLDLPRSAFLPDHTGAGQTIVDSGTQFTFLMGPVYTAMRNEFLQQTRGVLQVFEDPNFVFQQAMDLCYQINKSVDTNFSNLPRVSLMFDGAEMGISGERLLYRVPEMSKGSDSVYCFTFGNSDLLGIEAFVIGNHHQQNVWMEFDLVKSRVGFAETRCDLASQRLEMDL